MQIGTNDGFVSFVRRDNIDANFRNGKKTENDKKEQNEINGEWPAYRKVE